MRRWRRCSGSKTLRRSRGPTWCPGGRQTAYAAGMPSATRSAAVSAASATALAASQVPGPIRVIVSMANIPVRAEAAVGRRGALPDVSWGSGKTYGTTRSCPGSSRYPPATHSSYALARNERKAGSWTASNGAVVVGAGIDERGAGLLQGLADAFTSCRHLGPLDPHPEPHLTLRLMEAVPVGPDHGHRQVGSRHLSRWYRSGRRPDLAT